MDKEPTLKSRVVVHGIVELLRFDDGTVKLVSPPGGDTYVVSWQTYGSPSSWASPGEELAKALALFDGRFEVRRYGL